MLLRIANLRERRRDIEAVKGVAILLVVFGHLVARQDPAGVEWYEPLRRAVYAFHMPLFLYLSGLVAVHSGFLHRRRVELPALAAARARRLLLPFFALGVLIVLGKYAAMHVMHVDNPPSGLWSGLLALVWDTGHSPAISIWYLFVLFVVSLGSAAILNGRLARLPWLLAASLMLFWIPAPAFIYLDRLAMFAPFFLLGACAGATGTRWEIWLDRFWPWAMALFLIVLAGVAARPVGPVLAQKTVLLLTGSISLPAIHGCLRNLRSIALQTIFLRLGRYSFMIYLFNTSFIGLAKGVLLLAWNWDGTHFLGFAPALMAAGLMGPMAAKRYAFSRIPRLERMTD